MWIDSPPPPFQHSLTRWIFATADQQRVSDLSECTRLERAELLSNSPLPLFSTPQPHSRALSPSFRQLPPAPPPPPPPPPPPRNSERAEEREGEQAKKSLSDREPEPRKLRGSLKESRRGGKEKKKRWTATKPSDCGNFPAPLAVQRESFGASSVISAPGDWTAPPGQGWGGPRGTPQPLLELAPTPPAKKPPKPPCFVAERQGQSDAQPCTGSAPVLRCKPLCFLFL